MMKFFPLREGVTTRQVLAVLREAHEHRVTQWGDPSIVHREELRRERGERRYVFGIGTRLRDTLTAHYVVGSGEIAVVFPNDYRSWDVANSYDRLRVAIYDDIVHRADIRDKSLSGSDTSQAVRVSA